MENKRLTLSELMHSVNSDKWPARWETVYDEIMDDYEKNGCAVLNPSYYDVVGEKYNMFLRFRDAYKEAATEISKDDALCRVTALICYSLHDRERIHEDISALKLPSSPDGSYHIKYAMLPAVAMACMADYTYELLRPKNLPKKYIDDVMNRTDGMITSFMSRNEDRYGALSWDWYQLAIDAKLFMMGRLEIELDYKFFHKATVFENAAGDIIALNNGSVFHRDGYVLGSAGFTDEEGSFEGTTEETEDAWIGYAYDEYGKVANKKVTLKKSEWKIAIAPNDLVVSIHIPPGGGMTDEKVQASFDETKEFLAKYFPEFDYKGFFCSSWLMDKQLVDILGEEANISKFCNRFHRIGVRSFGRGVLGFVFLLRDTVNVDYTTLPERTTLERLLKKRYVEGKYIYEMFGYIPKSKL